MSFRVPTSSAAQWCRRLVLLTILASLLATAGPAHAGIIQVNTRADETSIGDGSCSLREAISAVNSPGVDSDCEGAGGGSDTIMLGPGTYVLSIPGGGEDANASGDLDIAGTVRNLSIEGADTGMTTINAIEVGDRVIDIASGATVSISDLAIGDGNAPVGAPGAAGVAGGKGDSGGGIRNLGALSLMRVIVANNHAGDGGGHPDPLRGPAGPGGPGGDGGGIYNRGTLIIDESTVTTNSAGSGANGTQTGYDGGPGGDGGGIANAGSLTITRSTISDNSAGIGGNGGSTDSTPGNGNAGGSGGGISVATFASLSATDSTLSGNRAGDAGVGGPATSSGNAGNGGDGGSGGALAVAIGGFANLVNTTVSGNLRGVGGAGGSADGPGVPGASGANGIAGGLLERNSSCLGVCMRLQSSIVAHNIGGNCAGSISDGGHDLVFGDATCPGANADPKLGELRDNGGPTTTLALLPGSAAIDLLPRSVSCPPTDQRGVARPQGSACDAGAYEVAPPVIAGAGAGATGVTMASATASVNPNAQDTTVLVRYGPTTAYATTTSSVDLGAGIAPVPVSIGLGGLAPATTYHGQLVATNPDGTARSADFTFTTPAIVGGGSGGTGSSGGPGGPPPPTLSHVRQSARRWIEGHAPPMIAARRRLPIGTTFSFELNQAASVTFAFDQTVRGRKVGRHCVAQTNSNSHRPRCTRLVIRGVLSLAAHGGDNRVRFAGRLMNRRLTPGVYTAVITASNSAGQRSPSRKLTFTIVGVKPRKV